MANRISFNLILFFSCFFLLYFISGYAQETQTTDSNTKEISTLRLDLNQDNILSKELIGKLSEEKIYDLFKMQVAQPERILDTELDYYTKSGVPRFLTPPVAIWSSIFAFLTIIVLVTLPIYFRYKKNLHLFETINSMVAKGVEIPSELLLPPQETKKKRTNLANGILLLASGIGISLFFIAITDLEKGIWSIGLIPLLIGIGFIIIWRLEEKKQLPNED